MLHKLLLFFFSLCLSSLMAQTVPQAFKYQSVIRDAAGNTMANQVVGIQFQLAQDNGAGLDAVYTETHATTTSNIGLINLSVGKGTPTMGNFSQTDWSKPTFLNIAIDITGGTNYMNLGAAELLSVPYALYAANGGGSDADADPTNEIELPTDAVAGDIAYFDGTAWKKVPEGKGGQTLTLRNNGNPEWAGISTEGLLEVTMPNGEIMNVYPVDNTSVIWGPIEDIPNLPYLTQAQAELDFNGEANTAAIVAAFGNNNGVPYAAKVCYDLVAYGFDDWYLPTIGELKVAAQQLGSTAIGGNGQIPFQTVWTSSNADIVTAWGQQFDNGLVSPLFKNESLIVLRCVRK